MLPGSDICVRLKSLGPGYGIDDYHERIIRNTWESARQNNPFLSLEDLKKKETLNRYSTRLNRAGFRVVITYHCLQLKSCSKRRKYREYSPELIKEIRKFRHFTEMQSFCRKYRLDTPEQVENLKAYPNLIYFPVLSWNKNRPIVEKLLTRIILSFILKPTGSRKSIF